MFLKPICPVKQKSKEWDVFPVKLVMGPPGKKLVMGPKVKNCLWDPKVKKVVMKILSFYKFVLKGL